MDPDKHPLATYFQSQGERSQWSAGSALFRQDDPVRYMHWLDDGRVELVRRSADGQQITLQSSDSGLIAEASLYHDRYHCDGEVLRTSQGARVTRAAFHAALTQDPTLHHALTAYLANQLRQARALVELRSLKRIDQRLDAWIALRGVATLKQGQRHLVADQLGVTRAALYRELSKRRL